MRGVSVISTLGILKRPRSSRRCSSLVVFKRGDEREGTPGRRPANIYPNADLIVPDACKLVRRNRGLKRSESIQFIRIDSSHRPKKATSPSENLDGSSSDIAGGQGMNDGILPVKSAC